MDAALNVSAEGAAVHPHIMIPLVCVEDELTNQAAMVRATADDVMAAAGRRVPLMVGTMIELPRAALIAGDLAKTAEFFSL